MGVFVNPNNSAFQVALNSKIYVDKSGLLEYTNSVLGTTEEFICSSRPRRFGKSIAAAMLAAYYSRGCDSEKMFSGLKISESADFKKHLNQYDVIHLDIQWCMEPAGGAEKVVSFITENTIKELRNDYPEELPSSVNSLPDALSLINAVSGRKFIVIVDEWDVLIRDEAANMAVQMEYINFLRGMFKGNVPTSYIGLAYLTGILPIKKMRTQSAMNNFDEFTMLEAGDLAPYAGFTEEEVKALCKKYQQDFEKVKRWYDGYLLDGYHIYNPKAIVSLMTKGKFKSYWSGTGTYESVVPLINMDFDGLKTDIIQMLSGASVEVDVSSFQNDAVSFAGKDDVLTYLIHLGYLAYHQDERTAFIPNEEIRQEITAATKRKRWDELLVFWQESDRLLEATLDMDGDGVAEAIEKVHREYASVIQYNNENSLSSVLSIAYLSAMRFYFKPVRELPAGRGFADFVFIPKPEYAKVYPALLVELKWNQSAETAIRQIKEKQYPESILSYVGDILLVGISYEKKTKEHKCVIEKWKKAMNG